MEYTFVQVEGSEIWKLLATKEEELPIGEMAKTLLNNMKVLALSSVPKDIEDPFYEMRLDQAMLRVNLINQMGVIPYKIDGAIVISEGGGYCPVDVDKITASKTAKTFPIN